MILWNTLLLRLSAWWNDREEDETWTDKFFEGLQNFIIFMVLLWLAVEMVKLMFGMFI